MARGDPRRLRDRGRGGRLNNEAPTLSAPAAGLIPRGQDPTGRARSPSSRGQDTTLSRWEHGFESRWGRQLRRLGPPRPSPSDPTADGDRCSPDRPAGSRGAHRDRPAAPSARPLRGGPRRTSRRAARSRPTTGRTRSLRPSGQAETAAREAVAFGRLGRSAASGPFRQSRPVPVELPRQAIARSEDFESRPLWDATIGSVDVVLHDLEARALHSPLPARSTPARRCSWRTRRSQTAGHSKGCRRRLSAAEAASFFGRRPGFPPGPDAPHANSIGGPSS